MSERVIQKFDRSGRKIGETRVVTGLEGLDERWAAMEAVVTEGMADPILAKVYGLICNGCGAVTRLSKPVLPEGWSANELGEFCPQCTHGK